MSAGALGVCSAQKASASGMLWMVSESRGSALTLAPRPSGGSARRAAPFRSVCVEGVREPDLARGFAEG